MIRFFFPAALLCAGPAFAQDESQFVPFDQVLAQNPAFECNDYEPITQTCTAIGQYAIDGDRATSRGTFLIDPSVPQGAEVTYESTLEDGRVCGLENVTARSNLGPDADRMVADAIRQIGATVGRFCTSYYRMGDGSYVSLSRTSDGTVIPEGRASVTFHDTPPALRPQDMQG